MENERQFQQQSNHTDRATCTQFFVGNAMTAFNHQLVHLSQQLRRQQSDIINHRLIRKPLTPIHLTITQKLADGRVLID